MNISILGMKALTKASWKNGDRLVAKFDCTLGCVQLAGCLLILTRKGKLLAQTPRLGRERYEEKPILITDPDIRLSLNKMASASFYAMGNVLPDADDDTPNPFAELDKIGCDLLAKAPSEGATE